MVKLRGGLKAFRTNWRLELVLQLYAQHCVRGLDTMRLCKGFVVLLLPYNPAEQSNSAWFYVKKLRGLLAKVEESQQAPTSNDPVYTGPHEALSIERENIIFRKFFEDLEDFKLPWHCQDFHDTSDEPVWESTTETSFNTLRRAIGVLGATRQGFMGQIGWQGMPSHNGMVETSTLTCLFYILILLQRTSTTSDRELKDTIRKLEERRKYWSAGFEYQQSTIRNLRWIMLETTDRGPEHFAILRQVEMLMKVTSLLGWHSWEGVRDCLISKLSGEPDDNVSLTGSAMDSILAEPLRHDETKAGWTRNIYIYNI